MSESSSPSIAELGRQLAALQAENRRLRDLLGLDDPARTAPVEPWKPSLFPDQEPGADVRLASVGQASSQQAKVALFRSLFAGREDVYALRWENERTGKAGWGPAVRGGWVNARKQGREYLAFSDQVIASHLAGEIHAGLYPLLRGDACRLLVCDFDGTGWVLDALAYLDAARAAGVPAALERSRSDEGAHVWVLLSGPVPATSARQLGVHLLREAMTERGELDLASYDRLFPTQDFMPRGSFGNLIALPLQGQCRKKGTTVFLDPTTLEPVKDQWAYLAGLPRLARETLAHMVETIGPVGAGPDDATYRRPRSSMPAPAPPETIHAWAGAMLAVERSGIPPALLSALKHLASLHNPQYYEKERLRLSTWNTPRFIRCYGETLDRLLLPRGLREQAASIVAEAGSRLGVHDECRDPEPVGFRLRARLTAEQQLACDAIACNDQGVLVAPPGTGKTVIACALIAHYDRPTLVIVDRKPLVEQWRDRLATHLGLDPKAIGQLGGGRNRTRGIVDIAMAQSLARREDIAELTAGYGLVVVDECHHVPAVTFERCVRQIPVRRWLGLTATPYRRDGLQGLITMYCGPIRHRITTATEAMPHRLELVVHRTKLTIPEAADLGIQELFRALVADAERTRAICADIAAAVANGRNCLVLTQWTEHIDLIVAELGRLGLSPLVLQGGMGKKARSAVIAELTARGPAGGLLLIATGSFLGEGFDCPSLDTLFLAFPIAFKGRIVQYVGRVLRPTDEKTKVEVHDYVDAGVPVLARMHAKRLPGFASLGFDTKATRSGRSV
ncbi:MAG: DEAD/DEAH box helicase family protein [Actinobacteria bacterium]|nr:DEAD/DEAH box helicase family protein [Actinomycetota bacterium]